MDNLEATLSEAEAQDDLVRTQPPTMLDDEVLAVISARHNLMVGMANISATTLKIDKLLATKQVSQSALLTKALQNLKRDILVGLAQVRDGVK